MLKREREREFKCTNTTITTIITTIHIILQGGSLALRYAAEGPESKNISALIITSPLLRSARVNNSTVKLGTGLSKVLPNLQFNTKIEVKYVSRDPEECLKYANDPYNHPYWSLKGGN